MQLTVSRANVPILFQMSSSTRIPILKKKKKKYIKKKNSRTIKSVELAAILYNLIPFLRFVVQAACFSAKLKSEDILHPGLCLAPLENIVKLKIEFSLTVKYPSQPVKSFQFSFYLQVVFGFSHSSHTRFEYHSKLTSTPAHAPTRERQRAPPTV